MKEYNQLFKDIVSGLKNQGYLDVGGNDDCFLIMKNKEGKAIKIFLNNYDKTNEEDINHVVVRFM